MQRVVSIVYNGHKRVHAIKFQSVVTRSEIIENLYVSAQPKDVAVTVTCLHNLVS